MATLRAATQLRGLYLTGVRTARRHLSEGPGRSANKRVLIVYAHQSPKSFNCAVKDTAVKALTDQGCKVTVSDLYSMKFKAVATADDIKGKLENPEHFSYNRETTLAWKEGRLTDDIKEEQRKVEQADLIIFQFPVYWFSIPAIMKGWMDRVLTSGFAYTIENLYDNGMFKNKKAMLSFTTGGTDTMYLPDGLNGDINVLLWPLQNGILRFCGFQVLAPQIFWSPAHTPADVRATLLEGWKSRLQGIMNEKPLSFAPTELFDLSFQAGFRLRKDVKEEYASKPYGLTTAHHLGKPLPPNNQTKSE
ncbi:NAD(P)H dehydrogenase [quinone] 1-like isoform X1 [Clarias gariepinus]|uniref:NAD(P)H dehydrogenase [quinone] 1-like isoform X1 n=1 Tax=Clarias gariepinus TaxID=13013 RepID=UPI00234DFBD8|nr:NAD(P)H dehydrogenase [quinone] 1-like isoform X1 [Clarias gariepinus]